MITLNDKTVPTCKELGEQLIKFGDQPLFNGDGYYVAVSFEKATGGVQLRATRCNPAGTDPHTKR